MSPLISYAQNGEDILLHRALHDVENGFYVDVGAWDPVIDSVTKHFYDRGWRGINLEPGVIFPRLAAARPGDINLNVAASDHSGFLELYESPSNSGISSVEIAHIDLPDSELAHLDLTDRQVRELNETRESHPVPCLTLSQVFDHYLGERTIDFLKVDVEGHERQVIAGNDWQRFRPRVVVVEATQPMTTKPAWQDWESLLTDADYEFVFFDGLNRFYVRSESGELKQYFSAPANVFDGFVPEAVRDLPVLRNQLAHLQSVINHVSARRLPPLPLATESPDSELEVEQVLQLANELDRAHEALAASKIDALKSRS